MNSMPDVHQLDNVKCPACGKVGMFGINLDAHTRSPVCGDKLVCGCGTVLRFKADMTLEVFPQAEFDALPQGMKNAVARFIQAAKMRNKTVTQ